jgi:AcrR family transcriptional regulator
MKNTSEQSRIYGGVEASLREEERRKKLIEAGLDAFGTKGYAKSNIKMICRLAGLTERYFYESFKHKEDLLRAVYRELIEEEKNDTLKILEDPESQPMEAALRAIEMFFLHFQHDPRRAQVQLFEVLGVSLDIDREYQNAMRILAEIVKLFLCRIFPDIREEALNKSIIPTALAGSIIMVSHEWVLGGFITPLHDIIIQLTDLLTAVGKHLSDDPAIPKKKSPTRKLLRSRRNQ